MTNQNNEPLKETLFCPKCGGALWKRGKLYKKVGFIQKYECKKCRKVTTRPAKQPLNVVS
jgi:predicted RNA-binding Zn-ribbon protein involved in translation (DUF1610 family)